MTIFLLLVSRNRIGRRVGKLKFSFGGKFEFKSYLITTIITCQFDEFFLLLVSRNRIGRRVGRRSNFFGTSKEGTREETTSEQQKSRQNAQADVVGGCRADKSWAQNMTWWSQPHRSAGSKNRRCNFSWNTIQNFLHKFGMISQMHLKVVFPYSIFL